MHLFYVIYFTEYCIYFIILIDKFDILIGQQWAGISQSVQRLATEWTVRGSNPGGSENFRTRPDQSWGPTSLLYNGYRVFPGGKAAGAWGLPPTLI